MQRALRVPGLDILDYHQRSKHRPERYAPGPGYLDWASQPDPFRTFAGSERVLLPLRADGLATRYADLRCGRLPAPAPLTLENVGVLFELSLGLSAWKQYGGSRWALRCNPSSGNLHPTEGYLIAPALPGLPAGLWHYASRDHALELRARSEGSLAFAGGCFVALTSIHWREAWKYGMRAFRYCQHDCGHAIAAIACAASALGWQARLIAEPGDGELAALLGLERGEDFEGAEREVADCLLWVGAGASPPPAHLSGLLAGARWRGRANRLSDSHRPWADIDLAQAASRKPRTAPAAPFLPSPRPPLAASRLDLSAATLIRRRRSAVAFDGETSMAADAFFGMLDALLPRSGVPPWPAWDAAPAVHLALFVHRVEGLEPGLYLLLRDAAAQPALHAALRPDWLWQRLGPAHLPLFMLLPYDLRAAAAMISCNQDIAADSCFSLGMLGRLDDVPQAPWRYRRRYWECGLIGQALYLEAEAAGLRGTGIGCFFDDQMHDLLGISGSEWQSLYHFTVGGPVEDTRLTTLPPYAGRTGIANDGRSP
jgi:SagB-type dehydrogenase family enzyme